MNTFSKLAVAAVCVVTFATAYGLNAPENSASSLDQQQWYTDAQGNPTSPVGQLDRCENINDDLCSDLFDMQNGVPVNKTGLNEKNGPFI